MKKWFEFKNLVGDVPVLDIFDEIGGWGVWAEDVVRQLDQITANEIKVRIFSPGGYIDEGMMIYNALRRHSARIVVEIDAQAASIASVVAMAGDEIRMADTAFMMIHDPSAGVRGDAGDMRKAADVLDQYKVAIVLAYQKRTGLDVAKIESMMTEETTMSADDAVDLGFADKIDDIDSEGLAENKAFSGRIVGLGACMLSPRAMQKKEMKIEVSNMSEKAAKDVVAVERQRVKAIQNAALCAKMSLKGGESALAQAAIESGASLADFQSSVLDAMNKKAKDQASPIGLSNDESQSFSFIRLMNAMATNDWGAAGFERSVCEATAQRMGKRAKGAMVPTDVISRPMNVITSAGAGSTIQTDVLAMSFIDLLRNKMRVRELGATVLGGLEGNVSIPRLSGGASAFWVAEGAAPAQSQAAFDAVTLAPNGVAAETLVTSQTLLQSGLDMEGLIRSDLASAMALAIDAAAIAGTGAGGQPLGILNTTGVGSVLAGGAALSSADLLIDLEAALTGVNADEGNLAYLTNAKVIAQMKKLKTTTGEYLWTNAAMGEFPSATLGDMNGYAVSRSNQVPANLGAGANLSAMLFGNWSDLLIGEWGVLDLQVDPYTAGVGNVKVTALQFVDVAVRHPESFAVISDILA